jgi:hypothetical protein
MKHLTNNENLHATYTTWQEFLDKNCYEYDSYKDWFIYNDYSNGYYIVDSDGRVYDGLYGYNAQYVWNRKVEELGRSVASWQTA